MVNGSFDLIGKRDRPPLSWIAILPRRDGGERVATPQHALLGDVRGLPALLIEVVIVCPPFHERALRRGPDGPAAFHEQSERLLELLEHALEEVIVGAPRKAAHGRPVFVAINGGQYKEPLHLIAHVSFLVTRCVVGVEQQVDRQRSWLRIGPLQLGIVVSLRVLVLPVHGLAERQPVRVELYLHRIPRVEFGGLRAPPFFSGTIVNFSNVMA